MGTQIKQFLANIQRFLAMDRSEVKVSLFSTECLNLAQTPPVQVSSQVHIHGKLQAQYAVLPVQFELYPQ